MKISIIAISTLVLTLSACAPSESEKKSSSPAPVNADGTCSADLVSKYNAVVLEAQSLRNAIKYSYGNTEIKKKAQVLKNACQVLFPQYANIKCRATQDYVEKELKTDDLKPACEAADETLALLQ